MFIRIDFKDGTFSWQVADTEASLVTGTAAEMGVSLKGTANSETEAMKAGIEASRELTKRRKIAETYPKVIEVL